MHDRPVNWHKMRLRQAILEDFAMKLKELSAESEAKINNQEQDDAEKTANLNEPAIVKTTSAVAETILNVASQDFHFEIEYSATDGN
jgi:hypothetical protein